jgi:hypothetical protein
MNQTQVRIIKRLVNAKYNEVYKNRTEESNKQVELECERIKKQEAKNLTKLAKLYKEATTLEKDIEKRTGLSLYYSGGKEGVEVSTYGNFRENIQRKHMASLRELRVALDAKLVALELSDLNQDAVKLYEELISLFN